MTGLPQHYVDAVLAMEDRRPRNYAERAAPVVKLLEDELAKAVAAVKESPLADLVRWVPCDMRELPDGREVETFGVAVDLFEDDLLEDDSLDAKALRVARVAELRLREAAWDTALLHERLVFQALLSEPDARLSASLPRWDGGLAAGMGDPDPVRRIWLYGDRSWQRARVEAAYARSRQVNLWHSPRVKDGVVREVAVPTTGERLFDMYECQAPRVAWSVGPPPEGCARQGRVFTFAIYTRLGVTVPYPELLHVWDAEDGK